MNGFAGGDDSGKGGNAMELVRGALERIGRGLGDAGKLDKSLSLVWG